MYTLLDTHTHDVSAPWCFLIIRLYFPAAVEIHFKEQPKVFKYFNLKLICCKIEKTLSRAAVRFLLIRFLDFQKRFS